jgi:hypothetical protein
VHVSNVLLKIRAGKMGNGESDVDREIKGD